jgi:hypothetical protein
MKQDLMSDPFMEMGMLERGPFSSPTSTQLLESTFSINLNFQLEKIEGVDTKSMEFLAGQSWMMTNFCGHRQYIFPNTVLFLVFRQFLFPRKRRIL